MQVNWTILFIVILINTQHPEKALEVYVNPQGSIFCHDAIDQLELDELDEIELE